MRTSLLFLLTASIMLAGACSSTPTTPKPRGYYRIAIPSTHSYRPLTLKNYPYSFDISSIASATPNTDRNSEPYWLNIYYPDYDATIYISYKPITRSATLAKFVEDAHLLVYRHTIKADGIGEIRYRGNDGKTFGYLYELEGNAATSAQFYITDSTANFLRGSLYFNTHPNYDSLAPVIRYITDDMMHLMKTVEWKKEK